MEEPLSIMNVLPDKKTFELIARELGISEAFVEKDWFVTQALSVIAKIKHPEFKFVFSGGTALSKAHKLIQRFSEDIDFILIISKKNQNRKTRSDLKHAILKTLRDGGFQIEENKIQARNENRFIAIDMNYESSFTRPNSLRPHIQIEMTVKTTQLPPVDLSVSSFVAELTKKAAEVERISCMDPAENAADKLSALAWRVLGRVHDDLEGNPTVVRHIYDLAMLQDVALNHTQFPNMITTCMEHDESRLRSNSKFVGLSMQEKFKLMLSKLDSDTEYAREYDRFVKGVLYSATDLAPDFALAVEAIKRLVKKAGN